MIDERDGEVKKGGNLRKEEKGHRGRKTRIVDW